MGRSRYALVAFAAVSAAVAGCGDDAARFDLPSFNDITGAPPAIKTAADAVVRVATANGYATGAFISPTGLLLTNNHVLGAEVCPIDGCQIQLRFGFQRGQPVTDSMTVKAVPIAVDVGLDMAIVQIWLSGSQLGTPHFLEIQSQDPSSLLGQHVTLVGHPEGRLKKWTDGVVIDAYGDWFTNTAYTLPGDSGSPVLDDAGKLVGLNHRGPRTVDLITDRGVNVYSVGTASASIVAAQSAPLPSAMISLTAPTTADAVVANNVVYQNGGAGIATVGGSVVAIVDQLAAACDAALARTDFASPDDLDAALTPCADGQRWIECRSDATPVPYATGCPDLQSRTAWTARFHSMNDRWVAMNGNTDLYPVSFGVAALQPDQASGQTAGAASMIGALNTAQQPIDFSIANYLAAFGVNDYAGLRSRDWLRGYDRQPDWQRGAFSIASAFGWWFEVGEVTEQELLGVLNRLEHDPDVDVHSKLYIDEQLYFAHH